MIFLSFFKYIVIDLNDVPLNINAMQKAERNMVGLDCLHEFVIIADASLRHDIDDKEKFEKLLESENVEEVPAGNDYSQYSP